MDLEQLTKSQIVLLTMLVSFVTSIATGIVTVALVEEAPADVTRVVQRVVERTVETVSPATQQATVITKEKTIIVKEADQIAAAIASNKPRIVSVVDVATGSFVALGVFIDDKGTLATDAASIKKLGEYGIDVGAEELVPADILYEGGARGIALLQADPKLITVKKITPSEVPLQLGQTLVAFVGGGSVTQGIVAELVDSGLISTTIAATKVAPGALLITVDGEVVGMSTGVSREVGKNVFVPIRAAFAQAANATTPPADAAPTTSATTPATTPAQ